MNFHPGAGLRCGQRSSSRGSSESESQQRRPRSRGARANPQLVPQIQRVVLGLHVQPVLVRPH